MGGLQDTTDVPEKRPQEMEGDSRRCFSCSDRTGMGMGHTRLATVATSGLVPVGVLLFLRLSLLLLLVAGDVVLALALEGRSKEEPPPFLCLPYWSCVVASLYFLMAAAACLRQMRCQPFSRGGLPTSSSTGEPAARRSWSSTTTLFLLEVSVVYLTITVPIAWIGSNGDSQVGDLKERTLSTVALGAVLTDLFLSRCRVEAKHAWTMLAFLLLWALAQVAWVHAKTNNKACYRNFDAVSVHCLLTALISTIIVIATVFAYAVLCAQRDRLTSHFKKGPDLHSVGADVEEDMEGDASVPGSITMPPHFRLPAVPERGASVINPIFAGSGSRFSRPWPSSNTSNSAEDRTCVNSNDLMEMPSPSPASGDVNVDPGWPPDGEPYIASLAASRSTSHSRGFLSVAPMAGVPSSSWARFGGAAAWVRSSERDVVVSGQGRKGHVRKASARF